MHLLQLSYLEVNSVNDKWARSETDEYLESVQAGYKTLRCQLDTGAYASVLSASQLQELAPNTPINPTSKILVSYSQHRITPVGHVILSVRHKDRVINAKFISSTTNRKLYSQERCQDLNLNKQVQKLDTSVQELLDQHPELENASGVMPGNVLNQNRSHRKACSTWPTQKVDTSAETREPR